MIRKPVKSSNLKSVGYDGGQRRLEVEFQDGRIIQFYEVPDHVYYGLMNSGSKGAYFNTNVRSASYHSVKKH